MVRQPTCPICKNPMPATDVGESAVFPFCSERCRDVDLLRWSDGRYTIVEPLDPNQLSPADFEPDDSLEAE